jgi:hypothetical protein
MRDVAVPEPLPSRATINRILLRHGLVGGRSRRKRSEYVRWERPAAMQLWQIDIVYGRGSSTRGRGRYARGGS